MTVRWIAGICFVFALLACSGQVPQLQGTVRSDKINSVKLNREIDYTVYEAPGFRDGNNSLSILYLLHGHGGNNMDWFEETEGNVAYILDSLISEGKIPALVAVSADAGNSWYVDGTEKMNSFYMSEFIPYFEKKYVSDNKDIKRHIAGNSAGGYGALRFALQEPNLFKNVILLSPAAYDPLPPEISSSRKVATFAKDGIFNDSIWESYSYKNLLKSLKSKKKKPVFYLSVGDDDAYNIVPVVTSLQQYFLKEGIANELRITNGGHDWACWRKNFTRALSEIFSD